MGFKIRPLTRTASEVAELRTLIREYAATLGFSLDYQGLDAELDHLETHYAAILLAHVQDKLAGAVALKRLDATTCEMKRLYVRPEYRALKIGKALVYAIVDEARAQGFDRMRLDTIAEQMPAATALYKRLGFVTIAPYYPGRPGTTYMELQLTDR